MIRRALIAGVTALALVAVPVAAAAGPVGIGIDPVARGLALKALPKSGGTITGASTAACGSVSVSTVCWGVTETWNNGATVFGAPLQVVITDTASASGSLAFSVSGGAAGTTNLFKVDKTGALTSGAGPTFGGAVMFSADGSFDIGGTGSGRVRNVNGTGYYASAYTTQSGTTYTVGSNDSTMVFTSASTVTLTLPGASSFPGRILRVKTTGGGAVNSASSNVVPKAGGSAAAALLAATAGTWAEIQSDGTNWIVLAGT